MMIKLLPLDAVFRHRTHKPKKKLKRKIFFAAGMMFGCGQAKSSPAPSSLEIESVEPAYGAAGDEITVTGDGLAGRVVVEFSGAETTAELRTPTELVMRVPEGARSGSIRLRAGTRTSNRVSFEVAHEDTKSWASVGVGSFHTCAVEKSGGLYCWGENKAGQLGFTSDLPGGYPREITAAKGPWAQVSGGKYLEEGNTCAIDRSARLFCFGDNMYAQFGNGNDLGSTAPIWVARNYQWDAVSLGAYHTCGITNEALYCWGTFNAGGFSTLVEEFPVAVSVPEGETGWSAVDTGSLHTCAISNPHGRLYCWGGNYGGQLGDGTTADRHAPVEVGQGNAWKSVSAGSYLRNGNTCAITSEDVLYCWGDNTYGQVGNSALEVTDIPNPVATELAWQTVSVGGLHVCAIAKEGSLWCWGDNRIGQLGLGASHPDAFVPARVGTAKTWTAVSTGATHTCALQTDGSLWCWGDNRGQQLGFVSTEDFVAVPHKVAHAFR